MGSNLKKSKSRKKGGLKGSKDVYKSDPKDSWFEAKVTSSASDTSVSKKQRMKDSFAVFFTSP